MNENMKLYVQTVYNILVIYRSKFNAFRTSLAKLLGW